MTIWRAAPSARPLVRAWRFGADELRLGGVGELGPYLERYRERTGIAVAPEELHWWEVLGNAKWAVRRPEAVDLRP